MKLLAQIQLDGNPLGTAFRFWGDQGNNESLPGDLVSRIMTFAIVAGGLYFFVRLISAGYGYLTSLGDPAKISSATKEITNAIIGLTVVVTAFFIMQLLQSVLGIKVV
jgi:hypothetical protein